jgi:hypothetical protein
MRETITLNRVGPCSLTGKDVAQQLSGYCLNEEHRLESALLTNYCSGESLCGSTDCQFIVGTAGKVYTKPVQIIYDFLKLCQDQGF